jgi:hypothetical protein
MNNQQPGGDPLQVRESVNNLYLIAKVGECVLTPVIRGGGFGLEYPGAFGLGAMVLILVWAGFTPGPDRDLVFAYLLFWFGMLLVQRQRALSFAKQGRYEHSHYSGFPVLMLKLLPGLKTELKAKNAEPLLCLAAGFLAYLAAPGLGGLVMFAAMSLFVTRSFEAAAAYRRVQQMRDAEIEMRQLAMRYRGQWDEY